MWEMKIRLIGMKRSVGFRKDVQEEIKHFSSKIDGIASCDECEKRYYDEYWRLKKEHWERTKCKGISKCIYKKCKTHGKGMFKWKQEKDEIAFIGVCTCGALERMLKRRKLSRLFYDCTVKIRKGVIKAVDNFKKPDEIYSSG